MQRDRPIPGAACSYSDTVFCQARRGQAAIVRSACATFLTAPGLPPSTAASGAQPTPPRP